MGKYKKNKYYKNKENNFGNNIVNLWVISMFSIFPLIFTNYYFNILLTKYTTFLVLSIGMLSSLILWKAFSNKQEFNPKSFLESCDTVDKLMLSFFILIILSTIFAHPYIKQAILGNEGRNTGTILLSLYIFLYFAVSRNFKFNKKIIIIFLTVSLFICLFGITDYFSMDLLGFKEYMKDEQKRIFSSTIGNINTYTTYIGFVVALSGSLFIMLPNKSKADRGRLIFYYICMFIGFLALITGRSDNGYITIGAFFGFIPFVAWKYTRGFRRYVLSLASYLTAIKIVSVWNKLFFDRVLGMEGLYEFIDKLRYFNLILAAVWVLTLFLYLFDYKKGKKDDAMPIIFRYIWIGIIVLFISGIITILYIANTNKDYYSSLGPISRYLIFDDDWGTMRGYVWRACIEEYNKLPIINKIFGTGPDTFGIYMFKNRYDDMARITGQLFDSAHNEYLQYLFTIGFMGLLTYIAILVGIIKSGFSCFSRMDEDNEDRIYIVAFVYVVLCYCLQAVVNINLPISTPVFWVFMMMIMAMVKQNSTKNE